MGAAYLSVDLDFWMHHSDNDASKRFFGKIFQIDVPITMVIEHEELLPDINKVKNLSMLYNIDYHSDIIAQNDIEADGPYDYDWANHVKNRNNAEYCWIAPYNKCYLEEEGTCHADGIDPFLKPKESGWRHCSWATDLRLIKWKQVERIGICLSPCFVNIASVTNVLQAMNCDLQKIEELIQNQPYPYHKRKRGVICKMSSFSKRQNVA